MTLKKEIVKTQGRDAADNSGEYRQLLVQTVHTCAVKFPPVAGSVVHLLMVRAPHSVAADPPFTPPGRAAPLQRRSGAGARTRA